MPGFVAGWVGRWVSRREESEKSRLPTHPPTHPPTHLPKERSKAVGAPYVLMLPSIGDAEVLTGERRERGPRLGG